jgi:hypothetical protein
MIWLSPRANFELWGFRVTRSLIQGLSAFAYKYDMRLHEITTIKPMKPLTPAQSRIATKKKQVDVAKQALANERETQHDAARKQRNRPS